MTCGRVQAGVSRAIDEDGDLAPFEPHLSACPECGGFAQVSLAVAARYRRQVLLGIERLRPASGPVPGRRPRVLWLIPLAAAIVLLGCLPLWKPPALPPGPAPVPSARVPLFDALPSDPVDLPALAWRSEPPLPRRLDQDLPGSLGIEFEPTVALPPGLRF